MSDLPFGLSADPFALPATLTAEQSARLIENRVRACGGDAETLFPPETCAEIHRHAHGVTGAVCDLAGKAMRLAAAAGAASVSPEHVRAAATPTADGGDQAVAAEAPVAASPATAEAVPSDSPAEQTAAVPDVAAHDGDVAAADTVPDAVAAVEIVPDATATAETVSETVAAEVTVPASDDVFPDDIPDLPDTFQGGIALPSEPSKDLAPEAQDWVSRFMSAEGTSTPSKTAARSPGSPKAPDAPRTPDPPKASSAKASSAKASSAKASVPAPASAPAPAPAARGQVERRRSPESSLPPGSKQPDRRVSRNVPRIAPRGRPRGRRDEVLIRVAAAAVIVSVSVVVVQRLRIEAGRLGAVRSPVVAPASPPSDTASAVTPPTAEFAARSRPPVTVTTRRVVEPPAPLPARPSPVAPAPEPQLAAPAESRGRFGIEVAAFIFADRADDERERLAAAGQRVRIVTDWENGAPTYRVVLGPYVSRAAAERAADSVLGAGLVQQARVVNVPRGN